MLSRWFRGGVFTLPLYQDDPGGVPDPASAPEPKPKKLTCEHCECQLAPDGRVMHYSERAAQLRDLEIELADSKRDLQAARNEVARLEAAAAPVAPAAESARGGFGKW